MGLQETENKHRKRTTKTGDLSVYVEILSPNRFSESVIRGHHKKCVENRFNFLMSLPMHEWMDTIADTQSRYHTLADPAGRFGGGATWSDLTNPYLPPNSSFSSDFVHFILKMRKITKNKIK